MREETRVFDRELSSFQASTLKFEHATEHFLRTLAPVLRAPLPRVWTSVEGGLAEPIRAPVSHEHGHTVGGDDATFGALEEARGELRDRIIGDVLHPVDAWRELLRVERVPELMRLQSGVDRRYSKLSASRDRFEARLARDRAEGEREVMNVGGGGGIGGGGGVGGVGGARGPRRARNPLVACFTYPGYDDEDDEGEGYRGGAPSELEPSVRRSLRHERAHVKVAHQQRKFDAALAAFREQERLVGGQLRGLAIDASWLKSYAVGSLVATKEALQLGVVGMHKTKQPLPSFPERRLPGVPPGALAENVDLAGALPKGVDLIRPTQGPARALLMPEHVHAHRATAQPLETYARPDVSGLERAATPPAGAADVALSTTQRLGAPAAAAGGAPAMPAAPGAAGAEGELPGEFSPMGGRMREGYYEPGQGGGGYGYEEGRPWGAEGGPFEGRRGAVGGVREEARRGEEEGRGAAAAEAGMGAAAPEGGAAAYEGYAAPPQRGYEERRGAAGGVGVGGGAGYRRGGAAAAAPAGEGDVCGRQEFVQEEDRPVLKERVERVLEHRPVEKTFVTETRFAGERAVAAATPETTVGPMTERIVEQAAPGPKCPREDVPVAERGSAMEGMGRAELAA